jgi:PAS domain S-box-containing protein
VLLLVRPPHFGAYHRPALLQEPTPIAKLLPSRDHSTAKTNGGAKRDHTQYHGLTVDGIPESARNERLHRLLECSSDGICEIDAAGRCMYLNATGAQLLGYEAQEWVGMVLHDAIHPGGQFLAPAECAICHVLKNEQGLKAKEPARRTHAVFSHKDGHAIPVAYSGVSIVVDGVLQGTVMTFCDDSQRRRLEGELRERTAELAEAERRKTEFIATLAHELRNPLAPIRTALQVMRKAADNATSMAQVREVMERQLSQMVRLINDLLDISRLTTGQMTLKKERVALGEILSVALEASAPLMTSTKNRLTLDIPREPIYLQADSTRLAQVFTNVLNNAAQYSPAGSPISVSVTLVDETVHIDIADVGVGIAREALNHIFEMFTRVGRDTRGAYAGLGIGLNLARRLVEMHDGRLVASSDGLGKGSHFLISLPLAEHKAIEHTAEDLRPPQAPRGAIRVVLVDDNADAAASLSLLLQLAGHITEVAHTGPEALRLVAEFKPDIVLLDLGLPGMNGYEVARAIRARPELGRPFLVAVTGWGAPEDRLKSKEAGLDEHLTKPVDISMIELLLTTLPTRQNTDGNPPVENGHEIDTSN